ncbi:hypothetical protein [Gordonia insulae]|uniref:Mce protein n=1 Tax=Gordonia insulae TaxID=2420509 RepID=A0A3G8JMM1_9ACTN|nr:hypothetical protein [Gordonia insulae]AZG45832.1 hypothetical protein D7316_02432 [Gordonia insulae]
MNTTTPTTPHKASAVRPPSARSTGKRIAGISPAPRRRNPSDHTENTENENNAPLAARAEESTTATTVAEAPTDDGSSDTGHREATDAPRRLSRVRTTLTGRRARKILAAIVVVVAIAGVGAASWFGWEWKQARDVEHAAVAAQSVAEDYAVSLTSVSADSVDKDFATVLGGATGDFKAMYAKSSAQLRQLLVDNKAQAQGKVIASGIQSASPTKVVVLLFIDQTVRNASTPEPRIDRSRVVMTMDLIGDRWLASKVDLP